MSMSFSVRARHSPRRCSLPDMRASVRLIPRFVCSPAVAKENIGGFEKHDEQKPHDKQEKKDNYYEK